MRGKTTKKPAQRRDHSSSEAGGDTSVILKDMRIIGDCSTEGRLRVHGRISGDVTARRLELISTGSVVGDATASEGGDSNHAFVIEGTMEGTVRATHVEVRRSGTVTRGIEADVVVVHGRVQGGILARRRLVLARESGPWAQPIRFNLHLAGSARSKRARDGEQAPPTPTP